MDGNCWTKRTHSTKIKTYGWWWMVLVYLQMVLEQTVEPRMVGPGGHRSWWWRRWLEAGGNAYQPTSGNGGIGLRTLDKLSIYLPMFHNAGWLQVEVVEVIM